MIAQLLLHSDKSDLIKLVQPHLRDCHAPSQNKRDDERIGNHGSSNKASKRLREGGFAASLDGKSATVATSLWDDASDDKDDDGGGLALPPLTATGASNSVGFMDDLEFLDAAGF